MTLLTIHLLPVITLLVTAPYSWLRLAVIPVMTVAAAAFIQAATSLSDFNAKIGIHTVFVLLMSIDLLVLHRLYLTNGRVEKTAPVGARIETSRVKPNGSLGRQNRVSLNALRWAYGTMWNFRAIGTPRQVKNTPQFSSRDPNYVPSRARFLMQRATTAILSYLVVDFLQYMWKIDQKAYTPSKTVLFLGINQLSLDDLVTRILSTLWYSTSSRFLLQLIYDLCSVLFVGFMINSPQDWPPLFGPVSSMYTIRNFWDVYWHQLFRNLLVGNAAFWTYAVFGQRKGTLTARYLGIFLVFLISGIAHTVHEVCVGVPLSETFTYLTFVLQACGIMAEDGVQYLYRRTSSSNSITTNGETIESDRSKQILQTPLWQRMVGYAWVGFFFVWSIPPWIYPSLRSGNADNFWALPPSVTGWVLKKLFALK